MTIDLGKRGRVLGQPKTRVEGPLKVSGTAGYAADRHQVSGPQLIGYPVMAQIAKGRIRSMGIEAAKAAPGVRAIVTTLDMQPLPISKHNVARLFGGADIHHFQQAIAIVVADSFEQARSAAALIDVDYRVDRKADFDLEAAHEKIASAKPRPMSKAARFAKAFEAAEVQLDQTYRTPDQSHMMMEPFASIAEWRDGKLHLWTSNQMINWMRGGVAKTLGLKPDEVVIDSPYIGGGFGGKLFPRADAILAALGAKAAGRPVRLAMPRPVLMNNTTHRSATIQRLRIGTDRDGRITALGHEATTGTLPGGPGENAVDQTPRFYAAKKVFTQHNKAELDLPESNAMRAPGEAAGLMALEIAMDEMAEKLGLDPVEFRAINDATHDAALPIKRRFSDRNFVECLRRGAEVFGWEQRNRTPGALREGRHLIGHGMAGAYRGAPIFPSAARVRLQPDGRLIVETDMTDIGTGSYTILGQTAAEMLGLELEQVDVRLGNSDFPVSFGSGGQAGAASSTAGVYVACVALREEIARRLGNVPPDELVFDAGTVASKGRTVPLADLAAEGEIVAEQKAGWNLRQIPTQLATFAAHFAEVSVDVATGEVRVRRMLAVCDAGRIMNPITARSQVIGGMVMGVGAALTEAAEVDTDKGFFANHDLASYEVPVHADIPDQEVIFLDTEDAAAGPLRAKGVGELGLCGVAAAIANAVYNATGVRVRDYPLTLDKLIDQLPPV